MWRALVDQLAGERYARAWGLRRLAKEAGVSLSVVTDIEHGNTWPRTATVEALAWALGYTLELAQEPGHPVLEGLMRHIRRQRRLPGFARMTAKEVAEVSGVLPSTMYGLSRTSAGGSIRTVLCLAVQSSGTLVLVPRAGGEELPASSVTPGTIDRARRYGGHEPAPPHLE